jgi:ABC-type microcin C transport system permease subunit YejB
MFQYTLKRLLIAIPTLLGITVMVFVIINLAPGSPIEQKIQNLRFGGGATGERRGRRRRRRWQQGFGRRSEPGSARRAQQTVRLR